MDRISQMYETDVEFGSIVDRIVDELHEPPTYAWVNKRVVEQMAYSGISEERIREAQEAVAADAPNYANVESEDRFIDQTFVDLQVSYLTRVATAVLSRIQ